MYDYDVTRDEDEIVLAIRDWNNGLVYEDIKKKKDAEYERVRIKTEDLSWKTIYANNMINNPVEGVYSIIHANIGGALYACKWSICFQRKEKSPCVSTGEEDLYILFMKRYFNLKEPLIYPEPSENGNDGYGVNDYGDFVRAYRTLDEAKEGAIFRCGWQGINRDTLVP